MKLGGKEKDSAVQGHQRKRMSGKESDRKRKGGEGNFNETGLERGRVKRRKEGEGVHAAKRKEAVRIE